MAIIDDLVLKCLQLDLKEVILSYKTYTFNSISFCLKVKNVKAKVKSQKWELRDPRSLNSRPKGKKYFNKKVKDKQILMSKLPIGSKRKKLKVL